MPNLPLPPRPRPALPLRLLDPSFGSVADPWGVSCPFPAVALEGRGAGPPRYKNFTASTLSAERNCSSVAAEVVDHCSSVAAADSSFTNSVSELTAGRSMHLKRVIVWLRSTSKTKKSVKLTKEGQTKNKGQNPRVYIPLLDNTLYRRKALPNVLGYPDIGFACSTQNAVKGDLRGRW